MATTKITITVDDAVLAQVRAAVDAGEAANVSAYIAEAAAQRTARGARAAEMERRWGPFSPQGAGVGAQGRRGAARAWRRRLPGRD